MLPTFQTEFLILSKALLILHFTDCSFSDQSLPSGHGHSRSYNGDVIAGEQILRSALLCNDAKEDGLASVPEKDKGTTVLDVEQQTSNGKSNNLSENTVSVYADHPFWSSGFGSTLKFCNLWALDPEEDSLHEKLLCLKKIGSDTFELRIIRASGECRTKCCSEMSLRAIDDWMSKFGKCTFVEWVPQVVLDGSLFGSEELKVILLPSRPTDSTTLRKKSIHSTPSNTAMDESTRGGFQVISKEFSVR